MKKIVLVVAIAACSQLTYAQRAVKSELPNRFFVEGKECFEDKNYVGCIETLEKFKTKSKDANLLTEADFLIISSLYYQGKANAGDKLKDFLEEHPSTYHRNQICFFIGNTHFAEKDWQRALYWFSQAEVNYLTLSEQEDYSYRKAYSLLQAGNKEEARQLFGVLTRMSEKYREPASYYLAYIDFQNGNYDQALPTFRRLKDNLEYRENATFFLMQGSYLQGDLRTAIAEAKDYVSLYPRSKNATEVYRIMGTSYYQLGDLDNSIVNYERYMQSGVNPFREDMFQLGNAYYQKGVYKQAIDVLKHTASSADKLGQAAYMILGQSYLKVGDGTNALMSFDAAARSKFDPLISEDALYNYVLLTNRGAVSAFDQSITAFKRFLTEYPNSRYGEEINSLFASTLLSTKNYKTALAAIDQIRTPGKQILEAKQMILFQLGVQEFVNNNYQAAENDFTACINMGNYNTGAKNEAYFWRGEVRYRLNDFRGAASNYTTYLSQSNRSGNNYALALYNLGYTNFQTKDYSNALTNFKKYVSEEADRQLPNYADALNRIGDCYLYARNYPESERYYAQAVNLRPNNADYSEFQKAFVLGLQRNYNGKISALDNMIAKYPSSEYIDDALYEKSRAYVMLNKEREAIIVLEQMLRQYPQSSLAPQAGVQLGQLYFNTNNPQKSIQFYKQVIKNYPNTEEARISIQSLEGVYKDINDIGSYVSYVNSLGGGVSVSAGRQDSLTYMAAENVYMKGQKTKAKEAFHKYIQTYPNGVFSADANFYLGNMAFEAKDYANALSNFRAVINTNNPKYLDQALIIISGIEYEDKNYDSAYNAYEKLNQVTQSTENRNIAQLGMLRCAYVMKKDQEVISAADKLLANEKTSPDVANEARFYKAKSLKNAGRIDEAIKDFDIVAKDTRNVFGAESQFILGETYFSWKSYDKAEKQIMDFMKKGTPHEYWMARAIIVLTDVYSAKSDKFQAKQYLESLKANYKGNETDIPKMIDERLNKLQNN